MSDPNGFLQPIFNSIVPWLYYDSKLWTAFGLIGNLLFSLRFIVQWLYSEKRRELIVPSIFWHLSFWGSVIALIYAFHIDKLPVILGYLFTPILYARNLVLLARGKQKGSIKA